LAVCAGAACAAAPPPLKAVWRIAAPRVKNKPDHRVPLTREALRLTGGYIVRRLHELTAIAQQPGLGRDDIANG
jgi:hypothetical protein